MDEVDYQVDPDAPRPSIPPSEPTGPNRANPPGGIALIVARFSEVRGTMDTVGQCRI
jgi:hypothetical protein